MWVCGCGRLWKVRLSVCPRCGGDLHPFGSLPDDQDHPLARLIPIGRRRPKVAPVEELASDLGEAAGRPGVRDSVDVWRAWAVSIGYRGDAAARMTKGQLMRVDPGPVGRVA